MQVGRLEIRFLGDGRFEGVLVWGFVLPLESVCQRVREILVVVSRWRWCCWRGGGYGLLSGWLLGWSRNGLRWSGYDLLRRVSGWRDRKRCGKGIHAQM
jgi:hypothetical protein